MLERLTLNLSTEERAALERLAASEMRSLREQARFLVRSSLERRGLLPIQEPIGEQETQEVTDAG
ncbi:MAG TPA: hypothetical protein VJN91_06700 [Gammaproteobacteria bacterium]|nr:hypothetical protein [Gammaproteobacteria bacterium]